MSVPDATASFCAVQRETNSAATRLSERRVTTNPLSAVLLLVDGNLLPAHTLRQWKTAEHPQRFRCYRARRGKKMYATFEVMPKTELFSEGPDLPNKLGSKNFSRVFEHLGALRHSEDLTNSPHA